MQSINSRKSNHALNLKGNIRMNNPIKIEIKTDINGKTFLVISDNTSSTVNELLFSDIVHLRDVANEFIQKEQKALDSYMHTNVLPKNNNDDEKYELLLSLFKQHKHKGELE